MKSGTEKEKGEAGGREGEKERKYFIFLHHAMKIHAGNFSKKKIRKTKPHFS